MLEGKVIMVLTALQGITDKMVDLVRKELASKVSQVNQEIMARREIKDRVVTPEKKESKGNVHHLISRKGST